MNAKRTGALLVMAFAVQAISADEMPWVKNWTVAMKNAKAGNKLIMVDFFADW